MLYSYQHYKKSHRAAMQTQQQAPESDRLSGTRNRIPKARGRLRSQCQVFIPGTFGVEYELFFFFGN